ncbi:MAG: hypothetical protein IPK87_13620 [Planctomycetes bacterium]|nr:hypothetical protein [Planctomycetota bacterium]
MKTIRDLTFFTSLRVVRDSIQWLVALWLSLLLTIASACGSEANQAVELPAANRSGCRPFDVYRYDFDEKTRVLGNEEVADDAKLQLLREMHASTSEDDLNSLHAFLLVHRQWDGLKLAAVQAVGTIKSRRSLPVLWFVYLECFAREEIVNDGYLQILSYAIKECGGSPPGGG